MSAGSDFFLCQKYSCSTQNNRDPYWDSEAKKNQLLANERLLADMSYSDQFSVTDCQNIWPVKFLLGTTVSVFPSPPLFAVPPTLFRVSFMRVPCICLFIYMLIWGERITEGAGTAAPLKTRINIHNSHSPLNVVVRFSVRITCRIHVLRFSIYKCARVKAACFRCRSLSRAPRTDTTINVLNCRHNICIMMWLH